MSIKRQQAYLMFALLSAAIVVLGVWLASLGDRIAEVTELGESFIGVLLLLYMDLSLMENRRLEPLTSAVRSQRSTN